MRRPEELVAIAKAKPLRTRDGRLKRPLSATSINKTLTTLAAILEVAFEYELVGPNQWGGVSVEIHGLPDKDGKPQFDDVSAYKFLDLQIFTAEPTKMRVEFQSQNVGVSAAQPPQFSFRTKSGMNAYKIKLNDAAQPEWVDPKTDPKDVLKRLTSVNVVVFRSSSPPLPRTARPM